MPGAWRNAYQDQSHRKIFNSCFLSLQQSVKLKVRLVLVEKHDLSIHILPGGVVEIIQEVADTDEGDVTTDQNKLFVIWRLEYILY